jgi:stage V sporulation protein R
MLTLRHTRHNDRPLDEESAEQVLKHVARLWGFGVRMESINERGDVVHTQEARGPAST